MNTQNTDELLGEISNLRTEVQKLKKQKRYGLVWEDKPELFDKESQNALPVLVEKGGKFKDLIQDKDEDFNILIEGDNYHSLSVLKYTHRNKIDVIYIDPPYNTGNKDFIYNDHIVDKEDSFSHSKWLSFMNKRLRLAKDLLTDDGVIFISIDDNEQAQLKLLCDEIFGHENFIENLLWLNKEGGGGSDSTHFKRKEEYILVYARNKDLLSVQGSVVEEDSSYSFEDDHVDVRGRHKLIKLNSFSIQYSESLDYPIETPEGKNIYPKENRQRGCWRWSKAKYEWGLKNDFIVFKNNQNNEQWVYTKQYFKVDHNNEPIKRTLPPLARIDKFSSTMATKELDQIMGRKAFSYSKPYQLIKEIINFIPKEESLVLDFMAGSGTTGHAVLELNKEDGGNRKFILCTNNENKICEDVTYERIKRVSQGYKNSKGEHVEGLGGNVKYLKTDFIIIDSSIDDLKQKIVDASTQILCLKEGTFDQKTEQNKIKIFENNNRYTAILFDTFYLREFKELLNTLSDKPVSVYVFAYDKNFSKEEFVDLNSSINYSVEPIPEKLLETYQEIFNF